MKKVSIIVPCYNEEEALPLYFKAVDKVICDIQDYIFDFVIVDDGSKDKTWDVMNRLYNERNDLTIIKETTNYGQQNALFTGLSKATGDYVIMMDVDLQDPVELIKDICEKFTEGYEVVNPKRASRKEDTFLKKTTAGMFYKFLNTIEGKKIIPENVNNFRGLSRRVVDDLNALPEKEKKVVSLVTYLGYKSVEVPFSRAKRDVGKTKYNVKNLFKAAFDIISSCTSRPLDYPFVIGGISTFFFSLSSLVLLILYILGQCDVMYRYSQITLWMVISFMFLGFSILTFILGVIAIYLRNILLNVRDRPMSYIEEMKTPEEKK